MAKVQSDEFQLVQGGWQYRNREDNTILPSQVLVSGSQNVVTSTSGRIGIVKGYELDGAASTMISPILSSFDYELHTGDIRNLRAYLDTSTNKGVLQFRYKVGITVNWLPLSITMNSSLIRFIDYWDTTEFLTKLLFVDGSSYIYDWTGGATEVLSVAANAITKTGTTTWAEEGFHYTNQSIGDSTTEFTITNPSGTTFRYTYTGTGTTPAISATTFYIGMQVRINAQNFNAGNNETFAVTGVGTNYFEVTNAAGVAEATKTIGTGYVYKNANQVVVNNVVYTYTSGADTTQLTGVTPNPVGSVSARNVAYQAVNKVPNSFCPNLPATFKNSIIANLKNQIYISASDNKAVYVSKVNDYLNYNFATPRVVGEGAILTLDGVPKAMKPQEDQMYISAGVDQWYLTTFTMSADLANETLQVNRLKTSTSQAAQSQEMVTHDKNNIVFISNEPVLSTLGRVQNVLQTPQITDVSFPVINDFNVYDFTDASVKYFKNFIYVAVPKEGLIRVYNQSDPKGHFWECPITYPVSRFSVIDGELHGHSYGTPETYKLFTGYNFRGAPIDARALFAFNPHGTRTNSKSCDEYWIEGYMTQNGALTLGLQYNLDGCATNVSYTIDGDDKQIVCIPNSDASLGKTSLGKGPLGAQTNQANSQTLPPNFRVIKTFPRVPFYLEQTSFTSSFADFRWELISFGSNATRTAEGNAEITE